MTAADRIVARGSQLERLDGFLRSIPEGLAVLTIEGEPGIGKTALWHEGVIRARADGIRVLTARASEAERTLTLTALADLLDPVSEEVFDRLPPPQRDAMLAALLRSPGVVARADRALSAAVLSLVRILAKDRPLLVAVDDAQWVDAESARVLAHTLGRLDTEPVGVLVTARRATARPTRDDPARFDAAAEPRRRSTLLLGPLSLAALHEIVRARTGRAIARPAMVRVTEACGGNPFFALEIAAELPRELSADGRLPLPPSLDALLGARLGRLPARTRNALIECGMLAAPSPELVDVAALEPAERAGIVIVERGRVRFAHPLFVQAVRNLAEPAQLRRLHRRLAARVADPEERARHLALAAVRGDEQVALELDRAGALARARGAPHAAAELLEMAVELTPPGLGTQAARRQVTAAQQWYDAGDLGRAQTLLERAAAREPTGETRGRALALLAQVHFRRSSFGEAIRLAQRALEGATELELRIRLHLDLAFFAVSVADFESTLAHAAAAAGLVTTEVGAGLQAEVLAALSITEFLCGRGLDDERLARALALEEPTLDRPWQMRPSFIAGCLYLYTGRTARAVSVLEAMRADAIERGEEGPLPIHYFYLTWALVRGGDLAGAREVAELAAQTASLIGDPASRATALAARALVHAHDGSLGQARAEASEAIGIFLELNWPSGVIFPSWALGLAELSAGNPAAADRVLGPLAGLLTAAAGDVGSAMAVFLPDEIESLVELDDLETAAAFLGWLQDRSRPDEPLARALAARCRALLEGAHGRLDEALAAAEEAVAEHDRVEAPFDRARTLLVQGRLLRRAGARAEAGRVLRAALGEFEGIGAASWSARVRTELDRSGARRAEPDRLTATEQAVARFAATGMSNREISERACLSVKTVEANLTRVYRKLGIRSRAALARALPADPADGR